MKCNEAKKNIVDCLEGEIDKAREKELKAHLLSCKECKKEYLEFKKVLVEARSIKVEKPDERYWIEFDVKLRNKLEGHRMFMNILKPVLAAAAVALILLIAMPKSGNDLQKSRIAMQNADESVILEKLNNDLENYYPLIDQVYMKNGKWEEGLNRLSSEDKDKLFEEFTLDLLAENI